MSLTRLYILLLFFLISCTHFLPKVQFPLDDLTDIKVYNLLIECDDWNQGIQGTDDPEDPRFTVCKGGIKGGRFYCDAPETVNCEQGDAIFLTGFDTDSYPKIDSYVQYLVERFKEKK